MTPEQKYISLYKEMADLCDEQGWGDPFSYARSKEILATILLGHTLPGPNVFAGADAINEKGQPVEYKSTTKETCRGQYSGISVHKTWEEQQKYLINKKIGIYPEHYYNRFENGQLVESWKLSGKDVLSILLPKFEERYPTVLNKKDPRLSANLTWREIQKYGKKVI